MRMATPTRYKPLSPAQRDRLNASIAAMPPGPDKQAAVDAALRIYGPAPKHHTKTPPVQHRFLKYQFEPAGYLQEFLGWEPWAGLDDAHPGQVEILQACVLAIRQQIEKRAFEKEEITEEQLVFWKPGQVIQNWIRVESGNGIGKTKQIAGAVQWFFDCFNSIVYTFHTSAKQDELTTWKEIGSDRRGRGLPGRILTTKLDLPERDDRFAVSRSTSDAQGKGEEKIKGQHNEFLMFVVDEADGVAEYVFKSIETMESGGISLVLMTANPRSRSTYFHRLKRFSYVKTLRISSLYHPNVIHGKDLIPGAVRRGFIEKQMEKGVTVVDKHDPEKFTFELPYDVLVSGKLLKAGTIFEPKPEFMWTVLGIAPPTALEKTIISVGLYEAAKARVPEGGDVTTARVGVDCARSGSDNGTVYIRWQDAVWRAAELVQQDTYSYVEAIRTECLKLAEKGVTSLHIRVDAGYGSGVIDALRIDAALMLAFADYQVFEVHFGSRAYNTKDYDNVSTEMYYETAESLKGLSILDPPDSLEIDLTEREYKFINRADKTKKILEKKEDFTKRQKRSPDDGDGFVLAVAPDHCFQQVSIEIVNPTPATVIPTRTSVVDDLARQLGLTPVASAEAKPERVLIIGWPKSGKTTLAAKMGGGRSTDETLEMGLDWSAGSEEVAKWFDKPGPWIIEGVAIPRALRKWAANHPGQRPPVDKIIHLQTCHGDLTSGQIAMGKGIDTVLADIMPWLREHNVTIEVRE